MTHAYHIPTDQRCPLGLELRGRNKYGDEDRGDRKDEWDDRNDRNIGISPCRRAHDSVSTK